MMIKGMLIQQQNPGGGVLEENMSNLTSASGEASISSTNKAETIFPQQQQYFAPTTQTQPVLVKKKRNLPGNPGLRFLPQVYLLFLNFFSIFLFWVLNFQGFESDQVAFSSFIFIVLIWVLNSKDLNQTHEMFSSFIFTFLITIWISKDWNQIQWLFLHLFLFSSSGFWISMDLNQT